MVKVCVAKSYDEYRALHERLKVGNDELLNKGWDCLGWVDEGGQKWAVVFGWFTGATVWPWQEWPGEFERAELPSELANYSG